MNKWIKRALLGVAGLAILGMGGIALGAYLGDRKAARRIEVAVAPVAIPTDSLSLERGRYLYASRGCADCHGANGGGKAFIDDDGGLFVKAPDISSGRGSVVAAYRAEDWAC